MSRSPILVLAMVMVVPSVAAQQRLPAPIERPPAAPAAEPLVIPTFGFDLPRGVTPPAGLADEPVDITTLRVTGAEALPQAEVQALIAELQGRTVPLRRVYEAANDLTRIARARGDFLTTAFVPQQIAESGVFELQVIEGWIERIDVVGVRDDGRLAATLRRIATPALARPNRLATLERVLLLIRDVPGVRVRATLQPLTAEGGATALVLDASPHLLTGSLGFDTRASKYAGRFIANSEVTLGSALGFGEAIRLRGQGTGTLSEQRYGAIDVSVPLGSDGWRLDGSYAASRSRPGYDLRPFAVRGATEQVDIALSYPVWLSLEQSLRLTVGAQALDSRAEAFSTTYYVDRTRSLSLGATYDYVGIFGGATRFGLRAHQGLDIADASRPQFASRRDGSAAARRFQADLWHIQPLGERWTLSLQAEGQYASRALFAADEYAFGGARFGRAFDPAEITGDHGAAAALELGYRLDRVLPDWLTGTAYGFGDIGSVWDRDRAVKQRQRASVGAGVRVEITGRARAFVEYAQPIGAAPATEAPSKQGRVLVGVQLQF
jgi:hemolysin activation/secretion protein